MNPELCVLQIDSSEKDLISSFQWRRRLLTWGKEFVLKVLFSDSSEYWLKTFNARIGDGIKRDFNSVRESLLVDCFRWVIDEKTTPKDPESDRVRSGFVEGGLQKMSMVPDHWLFWDMILSLYLCADHWTFVGEKEIASSLMRCIIEDGFNPVDFKNFSARSLAYIMDLADGKTHLKFLRQPLPTTIAASVILQLAISGNQEKLSMQQQLELQMKTTVEILSVWKKEFERIPFSKKVRENLKKWSISSSQPENKDVVEKTGDKDEQVTMLDYIFENMIGKNIEKGVETGEEKN